MYTSRELQIIAAKEYSIEDTRKDMTRMVDFFLNIPDQEMYIRTVFEKTRGLPMSLAREQKVFFVPHDFDYLDIPEEFRVEALGMVRYGRIIYAGRFVYPVFDVRCQVMGFCGWDKFVEPKYLDSKNYGYKAKQASLYGMEKMEEYYNSNKPVYVVEGIVCCLYLRSIGLQALALLGSSITPYVREILNRFGRRLIIIPDNDIVGKEAFKIDGLPAGEHLVKQAMKELPKARVIQSTVDKDVDDTRRHSDIEMTFVNELKMVAVNPFMKFKTIRVRKV